MAQDMYQIFREVTERVCGDLEIEKALMNCMQYLQSIMPADFMYMMIIDQSWPALRTVAMVPNRWQVSPDLYRFIPITQKDMRYYNDIYTLGKAVVINFPGKTPQLEKVSVALKIPGPGSFIHMRTSISEKYVGSVGVGSLKEGVYKSKHAEIFEELQKPFAIALTNASHYQEVIRLKDQIQSDQKALFTDINTIVGHKVIGAGGGLKSVMENVNRVATLESPVLLLGETGTGKEVMARYIHNNSNRSDGPFIKVDCGTIPENLVEAELFGHERGAFTGAIKERRGRFERAMDGTIFLDEIGELNKSIQVNLLRVLQDKEFERIGGSQTIKANVRVIAATHRNLERMVDKGEFREDLWYRLNVFPVHIPPLRERKEDIPELTNFFVRRKVKEMNLVEIPTIEPGSIDQLMNYHWPGNIRELQNIIERAIILSGGKPLRFTDMMSAPSVETVRYTTPLKGNVRTLNGVMRDHITHVLEITQGKVGGKGGAAQLLDIEPNTLRARMKKLGIPFGRHIKA